MNNKNLPIKKNREGSRHEITVVLKKKKQIFLNFLQVTKNKITFRSTSAQPLSSAQLLVSVLFG